MGQESLFQNNKSSKKPLNGPLPHRARPGTLNEFFGQEHIFKEYPFLKNGTFGSLIFWGPPGTGKTTLAHILANNSERTLYTFNAVLGGVGDLKKIIAKLIEEKKFYNTESIIFIDEIHRFNKAQQDALLPYLEDGTFLLIGATTENPRTAINNALLSRLKSIELKKLDSKSIEKILKNAADKFKVKCDSETLELINKYSNGDARKALSSLEVLGQNPELENEQLKSLLKENARTYDRNQDQHYNVISAFIKSMRGSDPDAALLWLAVMLDGGEDPYFIARRLIIFASEDVGNADPMALQIANSVLNAVKHIGMPEARISLAQATTYLASTHKSNAAYLGINKALEYVKSQSDIEVPENLKSHLGGQKGYFYPHDHEEGFVEQEYTRKKIPQFYKPTNRGLELKLKERLARLWKSKNTKN